MKNRVLLIFLIIPFYSISQGLLPLVKTYTQDFVIRADYDSSENVLVVLNNNDYRNDMVFSQTPILTSSLIVYDIDRKTEAKKLFFSTIDSNTTLSDIVKTGKIDTIRYFTKFYDSNNTANCIYYLNETNSRFDFNHKYTLNIPVSIEEIFNSYIIKDKLYFSGAFIQGGISVYDFVYNISTGTILILDTFSGLDGIGPTIHLSDSIKIKVRGFGKRTVDLLKHDTTVVSTTLFSSETYKIGYEAKILHNKLLITGIRGDSDPTTNFDFKSLIVYDLNTDSVDEVFLGVIPRFAIRETYGIDAIDTNHIYTVSADGLCYTIPYSPTCDNFFTVYSLRSDGAVNWQTTLGGFANFYPHHVIATKDTGALVLVQKFDENDPGFSQDCYWIKFNKDGTQDSSYLSNFRDVTSVKEIDKKQIEFAFYPNPTTDIIRFKFAEAHFIQRIELFDLAGKLILSQPENHQTMDLSTLTKGPYLLRITDKEGKLGFGKVIKY